MSQSTHQMFDRERERAQISRNANYITHTGKSAAILFCWYLKFLHYKSNYFQYFTVQCNLHCNRYSVSTGLFILKILCDISDSAVMKRQLFVCTVQSSTHPIETQVVFPLPACCVCLLKCLMAMQKPLKGTKNCRLFRV